MRERLGMGAKWRVSQDALVLFAAGNEGGMGVGSVTSPGLGKNFLTVGASRNSYQSFDEVILLGRFRPYNTPVDRKRGF
jgi:hypothetical protein